jgi:hypothetical protein
MIGRKTGRRRKERIMIRRRLERKRSSSDDYCGASKGDGSGG